MHHALRYPRLSRGVVLLALPLSLACESWHTTPLEPQHFSAAKRPEKARLTFRPGKTLEVFRPILFGDSLKWSDGSGLTHVTPVDSIAAVEVTKLDWDLLVVGVATAAAALWIGVGVAATHAD